MKTFFVRETGAIISIDDIIYIKKDPTRVAEKSEYIYEVYLSRDIGIVPYLNETEFSRLIDIIKNNEEEKQKKNGRKRYA